MSFRGRDKNVTPLRGRTSDSRWQWLFVGVVLGFGCAGVACLVATTAGYISLNPPPLPTQIVGRQDTSPTVCGPLDQLCGTPIAAAGGDATSTTSPPLTDETSPQAPATAVATETPSPVPSPSNTPPPTSTPPPTQPPIDPRLAAVVTDLVPVVGGTFQMGTNQQEAAGAVQECINAGGNCNISFAQDSFPPHQVIITSFQIERYEVTVRQFVTFLNVLGPGSHASECGGRCAATQNEDTTSPIVFDGDTYSAVQFSLGRPVTNITWFGARAYCQAIGRHLPTEAEWERAARGTEGYIYPWGWAFENDRANTSQSGNSGTMSVGSYPSGASPFGAEDMAGNVGEWVHDWYQMDFYSADEARVLNPQGPLSGGQRVIRGGAWDQRPFFSRTVHRMARAPSDQQPWLGFRCASDENPPPTAVPTFTPAGGPSLTPTIIPTLDPHISPTPLPTLPRGGD